MEERGFFEALFDISFTSFITTRIIKVLYVLSLILIAIALLAYTVIAFAASVALGVFVLVIAAPLVGLLWTIYVRVLLEFVMVVFRIMETNTELVALQRGSAGPPPTPAYGGGGASYGSPPPPPPTEPPTYPPPTAS
jgi:Domain of unknown function (DUF4282)